MPPGLIAALPDSPTERRALVLGAGELGRAAAWALALERAEVEVWNRTAGAGRRSGPGHRQLLRRRSPRPTCPVSRPSAASRPGPASYELIVNCTAVGMEGETDPFDQLPIDAERLDAGIVVVDLVYAGGETELVREARRRGATAVDGLEVLVQQGAESLRIWTGQDPPIDAMRKAAGDG